MNENGRENTSKKSIYAIIVLLHGCVACHGVPAQARTLYVRTAVVVRRERDQRPRAHTAPASCRTFRTGVLSCQASVAGEEAQHDTLQGEECYWKCP